jgi:hypothetical protein
MTMPLNMILIKNLPLIITIDSFYTIHKDSLVEILGIFEQSKSSSRGGARKGSLKTGYMLFGAYNLAFSPEYPHDIVISRDSRLSCENPVSGGRVFELGDEILLKDNANNGILITSLETGVSMLTVGNVSSRSLQVPIIVVFTKYDQLVIRKKFNLARSLANDHKVEWARRACYGGGEISLRGAPQRGGRQEAYMDREF